MATAKAKNVFINAADTLIGMFGETVALRKQTTAVPGNDDWYQDRAYYQDTNVQAIPSHSTVGTSFVEAGSPIDNGTMVFMFRGTGIKRPLAQTDYLVYRGEPRLIVNVEEQLPFDGEPVTYECEVKL